MIGDDVVYCSVHDGFVSMVDDIFWLDDGDLGEFSALDVMGFIVIVNESFYVVEF